jgi:hypothetical protein
MADQPAQDLATLQLWANDPIYNAPMLGPGRKRHPLSTLVLCSVVWLDKKSRFTSGVPFFEIPNFSRAILKIKKVLAYRMI